METATATLYVYETPHSDKLSVFTHPMEPTPGYIRRDTHEVTLQIKPIDKDAALQALRNSVEDVQAEATAAVRSIMDQIKKHEGE